MINTQINFPTSNHILQNLLSLTLTQLQPPTQRRNLNIPEVLRSHDDVMLQNSRLNVIQVVLEQYLLVPLKCSAEGLHLLLLHELVVEDFAQQRVVGDVLGSLVLHEL